MSESNAVAVGRPVDSRFNTFVMTDRSAHEAWAALVRSSPRAAIVMHQIVSKMGHQNAVVMSQGTLAKLCGISIRTAIRALEDLERGNWIQIVEIGQKGTVKAYVVNSNVAWCDRRENLRYALFTANVIADAEDQTEQTLQTAQLRMLPIIYPPEEALPHGDGEPGAQIALPGFEPVIEGKR